MTLIVATFYKFVRLADFAEKQASLLAYCQQQDIKGTILLAVEGINGTIVGSTQAVDLVLAFLRQDPRLADLQHQESSAESNPFDRLKVKLKKEIVTLGKPEVDPNVRVGTYVSPKEWNALISDPEVVVIDTRNTYEVDIGTFKGAQNPQTNSFRQFPEYVEKHLNPGQQKKVAMFCTGGIRCEKASSFMLSKGFQQVYHLQGGILKYLEEVPEEESLWQGECFVFDERVAIKEGLAAGSHDSCLSCGHPISEADKDSHHYQEGISCPYCFESLTPEKKARQQEKQRQLELARKRSKG
ncbi:MAG: rhodanese-related sulfurtransferase [Coleofasciculaceae cyanobacterium]